MTDDVATVVKAYGAAWLESDEAARMTLLQQAWCDDGIYQDPNADLSGRDALSAHIGGFHQAMPGAKIVLTSGVDSHHGKLRFEWEMLGADGNLVMAGVDFGELGADGRLAKIIGFFGPLPDLSE